MDIDFIMEVEKRAAALDQMDYFEVLRLPASAGGAEVKAAYYRESRAFHPDRFAALPAPELRDLIGRIYRRVNEAYTVLRDDAKRQRYLADVTGPERARKLRFTEVEETAVKDEQKKKLE
ncbi:MAG TPA: DnaJ domain-containing protein, partial [Anaeromyxobacteraceae bacterium]|nr:DnaJ domain-containing protein [Anaeromyxobacteraceae bacterium]